MSANDAPDSSKAPLSGEPSAATRSAKSEKPRKLSAPPSPPLSPDQIRSMAVDASQLLRAPVFNVAVRSLMESWQEQVMATAPHESAKREALYYKAQAMGDVLYELNGYVQLAQTLTPRELAEEERAWQDSQALAG